MSQTVERGQRRWRDMWQLHVPLVLVLALCAFATVIEVRRASEGVWRAWAYMFEWPLIGLFAIWIWNRYRAHGAVFTGLADRWRAHAASCGTGPDEEPTPPPAVATDADDAQLQAWRGYVEDLRRRDPPGAPPG